MITSSNGRATTVKAQSYLLHEGLEPVDPSLLKVVEDALPVLFLGEVGLNRWRHRLLPEDVNRS